MIRALCPRTSSAASGLRLLGMIDDPVDQASGKLDEAERLRRPQDDFLGQPRQMDRGERGGVEIIDDEVAVADRVEAVGGRAVEAERGGGRVAVEVEAGPGQRGAAQRAFVHPRARVGEAAAVADQHLAIGEQDGGRASPAAPTGDG